jgi:hypothetical protein
LFFATTSSAATKIPFYWDSFESSGITYEKAVMLIAVADQKGKFLQLDTGASDSYVYGVDVGRDLKFKTLNGNIQTHNFTCLCTWLRTILQAYELSPGLTIG